MARVGRLETVVGAGEEGASTREEVAWVVREDAMRPSTINSKTLKKISVGRISLLSFKPLQSCVLFVSGSSYFPDKLPPRFRRQLEMQGQSQNSVAPASAPASGRDNFMSGAPPPQQQQQHAMGASAPGYSSSEDRYRDNFFGPPSAQMRASSPIHVASLAFLLQ